MSDLKYRVINNCLSSIISINSFDRNSYEENEALKEALKHISTYPNIENLKRTSLKTAIEPDKAAVKVEQLLKMCLSNNLPVSGNENVLSEINSALFEALEYFI